jgi:hypothetical protein
MNAAKPKNRPMSVQGIFPVSIDNAVTKADTAKQTQATASSRALLVLNKFNLPLLNMSCVHEWRVHQVLGDKPDLEFVAPQNVAH